MSQEFFQFGFSEASDGDDFIVSDCNRQAYDFVYKWPDWESNIFLIYGAKSCGKSHLAKIWQSRSSAKYLTANEIYSGAYSLTDNYILDDIETMHDEATFLHFFNSFKERSEGFLLLTASNHPLHLGVRLADLRSRLGAVPSAGIAQTDDELLRTIFVKRFSERQLKVDMEVINYLITRVERSFSSLEVVVNRLDKQALKEKKNITIPFVRSVLECETVI